MAVSVVMFTRNGAVVTFLSSDTKPTTGIGIVSGALGIETDTKMFYEFDGSSTWALLGGDYPGRREEVSAVASWTTPGWYVDLGFNRTHTADVLYFTPIFVARETTFDRVGIDVNSAAAASEVARLGLYAADPDTLRPAALLNDFGTVLVDSTGDKLITISLTLQRGYYWSAHISNGTPQLVTFSVSNPISPPLQGWILGSAIGQPIAVIMESLSQTGIAVGGLADPAPVQTLAADATFAAVHFRSTP